MPVSPNVRVIIVDGPHKDKAGIITKHYETWQTPPWTTLLDDGTVEQFWFFQMEPEDRSYVFGNPKPSDTLPNPTEHSWEGYGYDSTQCRHCKIDVYASDRYHSKFCEDINWAKEEKASIDQRMHRATNVALDKVRAVLSREEWKLVGLDAKAPHRAVDYIRVGK